MKKCTHKSVGIIARKGGKILLIERKRFPFGFACPAGHVDKGESFDEAARRELKEEVDLDAGDIIFLKEGRKENSCRRKGGTWHYWKIYETKVEGKIRPSESEVKRIFFADEKKIIELAKKTDRYLGGEISEEEWSDDPGLEIVWMQWFKALDIIR